MCNKTLHSEANGNILLSDRYQAQCEMLRLIDLLLLPVANAGLQVTSCGNANTRLTKQYFLPLSLSLSLSPSVVSQLRVRKSIVFWTMIER
jgi:hypothetical protein